MAVLGKFFYNTYTLGSHIRFSKSLYIVAYTSCKQIYFQTKKANIIDLYSSGKIDHNFNRSRNNHKGEIE